MNRCDTSHTALVQENNIKLFFKKICIIASRYEKSRTLFNITMWNINFHVTDPNMYKKCEKGLQCSDLNLVIERFFINFISFHRIN